MSEKHLTELAWATLAQKHKIKDKDFPKALANFKGCPKDDFTKQLGGLEEIEKCGVRLQKENKDNKEIVAYLAEVLKEADKTCKAVELLKKSADQKQRDAEDDDSGLNLKDKLVSALKKVKALKPQDPPMEVMVCKAGETCGVLLAKKVGASQQKELIELLKKEGSPKIIKGFCEWNEKDGYTFVLESLPSGSGKKLKAFLKEQTGIDYKVRARGAQGETEEGEGEEGAPEAKTAETKTTAPTPQEAAAKFNKRFETLLPKIKEAIAAGNPAAQNLKLTASEAGGFARKQDFAQANKLLDNLEALLKKTAAPGAAANIGLAAFRKQWQPARQGWRQASDLVDSQIKQLQNVLKSSGDEDLKKIAEFGLAGVTGNFRTPLMTVMVELDSAEDEAALSKSAAKARGIINGFRKHVNSDETVQACDKNPFGIKMSIRETIGKGLDQLEETLSAAA